VNPAYGNFRRSRFLRGIGDCSHSTRTPSIAQSLAERLDVRLDATEVRPIELANVQDVLFLYGTQGFPRKILDTRRCQDLVGIGGGGAS